MLIFTNGVSDAAPGALIPYMEKHYSIGYAVVSLIFLANAVGFVTAAFISQAIYSRIGRARTLFIGVLLLAVAFLTISCAPPWGVVVASYFLIGAGMAFVRIPIRLEEVGDMVEWFKKLISGGGRRA
jgi:fucose permease